MNFWNFGLKKKKISQETATNRQAIVASSVTSYTIPSRSFEHYYRMYEKTSDLKAAVNAIVNNAAINGYQFVDKKGNAKGGDQVPFWDFVNYQHNFISQKREIIRDIIVTGNAYIHKLRNASGQIVGIEVFSPIHMNPVLDDFGDPIRYEYRGETGCIAIPTEDIVRFVEEKVSGSKIAALSILESLILDVLVEREAQTFNYAFFKNYAQPSALFWYNDVDLTVEQSQLLKQSIERDFGGSRNGFKNLVSNAKIEVQQLGTPISDVQFPELRKMSTEKICAALGVPKSVLNYTEGVNYTNADEQKKMFISSTVSYWERVLEQIYNKILRSEKIEDRTFEIVEDHEARRRDKIAFIEKLLVLGLITQNEGRRELGYEPFAIEEADIPLVDGNRKRLDDVGMIPLNSSQQ